MTGCVELKVVLPTKADQRANSQNVVENAAKVAMAKPEISAKDIGPNWTMALARRIENFLAESMQGDIEPRSYFLAEKLPPITLTEYIHRLIHYTNLMAEESFGLDSIGAQSAIIAVQLLVRLGIDYHPRAIHRYFQAAFLVAMKGRYEYCVPMKFWADVSGCVCKSVNQMEVLLCVDLKWQLSVDEETYELLTTKLFPTELLDADEQDDDL